MTNRKQTKDNAREKEVRKPFLTGAAFDERSVKTSLLFFGTLILVFFIAFIACASATFSSFILRLLMNGAVILVTLFIFYNNGTKRGTDDVTRGEILWQKKENGKEFSASEQKMCFHKLKGYLIGLCGSIPFIILAIFLALTATVSMTGSGTLPSWMQAYVNRSDIGNALINYTQPEGMTAVDFIRAIVRITIIPFVNLIGTDNKAGLLILERICPLLMLLPAAAYGTGYLKGRNVRTQIHTAISENNRRRIRKERKKRTARLRQPSNRGPEQLN